jgi:type I site-specific restriction-modification system R (restriction) subunit
VSSLIWEASPRCYEINSSNALFIGLQRLPLLKDKQKSIEIFRPYIGNPYKFDEAVEDGVVLDLLYEARDVDVCNQPN